MQLIGFLIFIIIIYMAYQIGRIKGRAEILLQGSKQRKRPSNEKIEEAEYEEIK